MFYYGVTDRLSLIGGLASAQKPNSQQTSQFSTLGAQLSLNGVSMQYNTTYNMNKNAIGHHFDTQGDVYIGTLFTRYEYYGDTESPISYYIDEYLRNLFEGRLTGALPWIKFRIILHILIGKISRETHTGKLMHACLQILCAITTLLLKTHGKTMIFHQKITSTDYSRQHMAECV